MIHMGSGPVLLRNPIFYDFSGGGGSGPSVPALDQRMIQLSFYGVFLSFFVLALKECTILVKGMFCHFLNCHRAVHIYSSFC